MDIANEEIYAIPVHVFFISCKPNTYVLFGHVTSSVRAGGGFDGLLTTLFFYYPKFLIL